MKRSFVLFYLLLLLISVACSLAGSSEQPAEEDRIATSVAGTVAAQTSLEAEPTDISIVQTPVPSIPPPTLMPTPTQNLTPSPTTISMSTPISKPISDTLVSEEVNPFLKVGDTIDNGFIALTLEDANLGESYIDDYGSNQEARKGYTFVYLDLSFVTIRSTLGRKIERIKVDLQDKDGDTYYCDVDGISFGSFPPGYGGSFRSDCELPITVGSTLDELQLKVTEFGDTIYTFLLNERSESPRKIAVEKEPEKHFHMDDNFSFTIICGSQHEADYVLMNPRWADTGKFGDSKQLILDMQITNKGKSASAMLPSDVYHIYYYHLQGGSPPPQFLHRFAGFVKYDGVGPVPGETVMVTIDFVLQPTPEIVPILFKGIENCQIQTENYTVTEDDYFVLEVNASDKVASSESDVTDDETVSPSTDSPASLSCSNEPQGEFRNLWVKYQDRLGCPIQIQPLTYQSAEQPFEGGHMFWVGEINLILITIGNEQGDWVSYGDDWDGANYSCPVQAPAGTIQPVRGFGWIWCREQAIGERLGGALKEEQGFSAGIDLIQGFDNGIIFRDSDGKTQGTAYIMFGKDQGTFIREPY